MFVAILSYFVFFCAAAVIHWGNSSPLLMSSSFSFILICVHVQSIQSMDYCWLTVSGLNIYLNCSSNRHRALTSNGESIVRLSVDVRTSGTAEELLLTINDPWCFMAAMRMFRICCFSSRQLNYNSSILIARKRKRAPKKIGGAMQLKVSVNHDHFQFSQKICCEQKRNWFRSKNFSSA